MVGVTTITSTAPTRPVPSMRGGSFCEMTPRSDPESRRQTMSRSCGGYMLMMRSRVSAAEAVCRVEKTRWPVSAAARPTLMVSMSRLSPISRISGF